MQGALKQRAAQSQCRGIAAPSVFAPQGAGLVASPIVAAPSRVCAGPAPRTQSQIVASLIKRSEDVHSVTKLPKPSPRDTLRMGLPSKGRMAEDTITLLKIPGLEVWFQRASDVVRKLRYGDIDLGIVGGDMFYELADGDNDLIVVHEALNFGQCHLGLGLPMAGKFANINTLEQLRDMPDWTAETPLRVVTGYHAIATRFFREKGFQHVALLSADGALEAAPAMGCADIILDLISTGVTLRENNLKQIEGGRIMDSQGMLVANKRSLLERPGLLTIVHELIERFDGHLKADQFYSVIANMRGESPEAVAALLLRCEGLKGLQGPTISNVYTASADGKAAQHGFYAATICVPKKRLYAAVKELQGLGGSGVLVQPMTYIFDEEPQRWTQLLATLGVSDPRLN